MRDQASYRDPGGYIFSKDGVIYRQVNLRHKEHYDLLMQSGLYDDLADSGLLIAHKEVEFDSAVSTDDYKTLKPEPIPFISYPYEWSFSQLKDAALTTLRIQKRALDFGMTLKDSSAYNIQFLRGRPILIDTLSFEKYQEGEPWAAYRQFCQHFLAPLALTSYRHAGIAQLTQVYIDGVPLDLASALLPTRTQIIPSLQIHIHLQARLQQRFGRRNDLKNWRKRSFERRAFLGLIDSLESAVKRLKWKPKTSEWIDYYQEDSYLPEALDHKVQLVTGILEEIKPAGVWDLGSNTGLFSRISSDMGVQTIAFDRDSAAVERNYQTSVSRAETNVLPLVLDLAAPSPKIGWSNSERMDLFERGPADMLFALALIHHLAITQNVPLGMIAEFFHKLCHWAVVEFVPKEDPQAARLFATREDIFPKYTQEEFEAEFKKFFEIKWARRIMASERTLYLMRGR